MASVLKSLLGILLGLGFLVLGARAQSAPGPEKPRIAFLGMAGEIDPGIEGSMARRIRRALQAESTVAVVPEKALENLFGSGVLRRPESGPEDTAAFRREIGNAYTAYGVLGPVEVASKRIWWMPWSLKTTWSQGIRLRVESGDGVVLDSLVNVEVPERDFLEAPGREWGRMPPLERERRGRVMAEAVSVEAARVLSRALAQRSGPATGGATAAVP